MSHRPVTVAVDAAALLAALAVPATIVAGNRGSATVSRHRVCTAGA
jgi:hypothetical protein